MNPLISRFITAAKLAVDMPPDHIDQERDLAQGDVETAAFDAFVPWAGSEDALVELLAYARTASFHIWNIEDEDAKALLWPIWEAITDKVPGLYLCWYSMRWRE